MDDKLDLSSLANADSGIGDAVSKLLARPDLISNIAKELGLSGGEREDAEKGSLSEEKKSPAAQEIVNDRARDHKGEVSDKKKLLLALRPYLNEKRREALDMMVNIESIGKLVGNIDPSTIAKLLGGGNV